MYTSLEQRMAQTYIDLFPSFIADDTAEVSMLEQEEFYLFMKSLYQLAFDEPILFVPTLHEDDAYPNRFHKSSYGKPGLQVTMQKFLKSMNALLDNMYLIGQGADVKLNKKQKDILSKLGINDLTKIPNGWRWMANRQGSNVIDFSHCFFKADHSYIADIYANLLGESAFRKLESWLLEQGYQQYEITDTTAGICKLSLTYANPVWSKESPKGGFEFKIKHTGISIRYDAYITEPCVLGLCIPNGLKTYLEHFEEMGLQVQNFVLSHTKKCDGCRYCIQTDKTGTRPFAFVKVNHQGTQYPLCPYFPGFGYCWISMNEELVDQIIGTLSFMDSFVGN